MTSCCDTKLLWCCKPVRTSMSGVCFYLFTRRMRKSLMARLVSDCATRNVAGRTMNQVKRKLYGSGSCSTPPPPSALIIKQMFPTPQFPNNVYVSCITLLTFAVIVSALGYKRG